jgi:hypothetical protein
MARGGPPVLHAWVVGAVSLIWNGFAGYDFLMRNARNAAYFARLPPTTVTFLDTVPVWAVGFWALGVWSAVLGSLLLLVPSRFAVHAFAASLVGLAANTAYTAMRYTPSGQPAGLAVATWGVAVVLLVYAIRMRKAGALG